MRATRMAYTDGCPTANARVERRPTGGVADGSDVVVDFLAFPAFLVAAVVSAAVWVIAVVYVKEQQLRRSLDEVAAADAAAGAPAEGFHASGSQAHSDGDVGGAERFHLGRDGCGTPLATMALRLQRRARERTDQPAAGGHRTLRH